VDSEEEKEIYARFGLAFYLVNCLEHHIANVMCCIEVMPRMDKCGDRIEWENLIDKHFDKSFDETFGRLKARLSEYSKIFPAILVIIPDLEKCVEERNFLAHHFYREYAQHWFSVKGRQEMIKRLEVAYDLFDLTSKKLDSSMEPLMEKYALTESAVEEMYNKMKAEAESYNG